MIATQENWSDVKKYFEGTYVKFKEQGEKVYRISNVGKKETEAVDSNGDIVFFNMFSENDPNYKPYELDYVIPGRKVYQFGDQAASLARIPARMWRKGMDPKNTQFTVCKETGQWSPLEMNHQIIEGFVNKPSYFTFDEAVSQFTKGTSLVSAALSPRVSITRKGGVFIDQILVGRVNFAPAELTVMSIYREDIQDLFPGAKIKEI